MMTPWSVLPAVALAASQLLAPAAQADDAPLLSVLAPPVGVQQGSRFGYAVAVEGSYAVVGAPWHGVGGKLAGIAKVFDSSTGALRFVLPNPSATPQGHSFGQSVAISGTRVVVAANTAESAYVFDLAGATPEVPVVRLVNPGYVQGSSYSVAISGNRVVLGMPAGGKLASGPGSAGIAYVYDLSSATPTVPVTTLNNPRPAADDAFGVAVAISGARVVVGDSKKETGASNSGSAYVFDLGSAIPGVPVATLDNPEPDKDDQFGASLAIEGTTLVVGQKPPGWMEAQLAGPGKAYVYDLGNGSPTVPTAIHNPAGPAARDQFGSSVALSGTRVVVGSPLNSTGALQAGRVYVFDLSGGTPIVPVSTLNNPSPAPSDAFGNSVAITGTRAVAGAEWDDSSEPDTGRVFLYDLTTGPGMPVLAANDPGPSADDHFGSSVAVSGTRMVVGVRWDDTGQKPLGSVYVHDLTSATPTVPTFVLNNPSTASYSRFGSSVAISGAYAVVDLGFRYYSWATGRGLAFVYDLNGATPTVPVLSLGLPSNSTPIEGPRSVAISGSRVVVGASRLESLLVFDLNSATPATPVFFFRGPQESFEDSYGNFGLSVSISGTRVVVGAPLKDVGRSPSARGTDNAGSAFIYELTSPTPTVPVFRLDNPDPAETDLFGSSVAISGTRVVVGAPNDDSGATDAGSAYVFDLASANPTVPIATLNNPAPVASDLFGHSVAISGRRVVVGADGDNVVADNEGSAYVFDLASATPMVPVTTLHNPSPWDSDFFGFSVAIDAETIAVGAPSDDTVMADKGAVYLFGSLPKPGVPPAPEIAVEIEPGSTSVLDGGSESLGNVFVDGGTILRVTIKNLGSLDLTGLATSIDGPNAADFRIVTSPTSPVGGFDGRTSFPVRFSPGSLGPRTATLHIASNDADESSFDITLTGTGIEPVNRVVDQGAPVAFSIDAPPGATVQWRKDDVDIPGAVGSTLTFGSVQPWQIGVYSARVTTAAGSSVRDVAVLGLTGVPSGIWRGLVACYSFNGTPEDKCRPGKPASLIKTSELTTDPQRGGVVSIRGKGWAVPPLPTEPAAVQGPGGYLQIPRPPLVEGEPFTASFVIKEEGFTLRHGESLLTMGEGSFSSDLLAHYWIGGLDGIPEIYAGPTQAVWTHTSDYVVDGAAVTLNSPWTGYTLVGDGTILQVYRDGQVMGTSPYRKDTLGDFFMGRHWWANGASYSTRLVAKVDDLRIYNRALTPLEVEQLFTLVQTTPPVDSFESWALINGLTGTDASPSADPDRDDLTNQDEFRLGTSPTDGMQLPMKATLTGTTLSIEWLARIGVFYSLKETSDLRNPWAMSGKSPVPSVGPNPPGYQRVHVDLPVPPPGTSAAPRFFRVEARKRHRSWRAPEECRAEVWPFALGHSVNRQLPRRRIFDSASELPAARRMFSRKAT